MAENSTLSRKQKRSIAAMLSTPTVVDAAKKADCSPSSIYRWLRDDAFLCELDLAASALIDGTVTGQISDFGANQDVMRAIRDGGASDAVKLRAAGLLDTSLLRWRELRDVERRLTRLEGMLNERV